jgi:tetratricopeptide (TPR) repeat protein
MIRTVYVGALVLIIGMLTMWSWQRNAVYRSEVSLWEDNFRKSPNKTRVLVNLAFAYKKEGKDDLGLAAFTRALEIDPGLIIYMKALKYADEHGAKLITEKDIWGKRG